MAMNDAKIQHGAWAGGAAADAWFRRNAQALEPASLNSKSVRLFSAHLKADQRVLEIGCANGYQIERLRLMTGCRANGIDPSPAAIADGTGRFPNVQLAVGTADALAFDDASFDAVIFGFCLYLVDRSLLSRVVAEADRVLRPGGRLMITDFDPAHPHRRAFKHQTGLWSYKMQYPTLWLASPAYTLVEKVAFSHEAEEFHSDPDKRVASWVLAKQDEQSLPEET
jgi:ubiquinone/menaquinone biosynthesis C-methylase UbiE